MEQLASDVGIRQFAEYGGDGLPGRKLLLLGTYRPEQDLWHLWLGPAVERLFDSCTCTLICIKFGMEVAELLDADPLLAAHAAPPADEEHAAPPADEEHV